MVGKTYIEDLLDLDSDGDDDVFMSEMPLPKAISKNNNVKSYAKEMAAQRETTMNNKVPQGVDPYRNFGNYEPHHPYPHRSNRPQETPTQQPMPKNISDMEIADFVAASYRIAQYLKQNDGSAYRHCSKFYDSDKTVYILIIIILVIISLLLLKKCLDV